MEDTAAGKAGMARHDRLLQVRRVRQVSDAAMRPRSAVRFRMAGR